MSGDGPEDHARAGVEHLQAAAREVIKATRSLLDAAEELVDDPKAVQDLVGTLGTLAQAAASRIRPPGSPRPTDRDADAPGADDGLDADGDPAGRVQRIRLS